MFTLTDLSVFFSGLTLLDHSLHSQHYQLVNPRDPWGRSGGLWPIPLLCRWANTANKILYFLKLKCVIFSGKMLLFFRISNKNDHQNEPWISWSLFFVTADTFGVYNTNLAPAGRILKSIPDNLVDKIWTDRPPLPPDNPMRLPDSVIGVCMSYQHHLTDKFQANRAEDHEIMTNRAIKLLFNL